MAATAPRVGSVASNSQIGFQVDLKLPDAQGAVAFAEAVATPGNAQYGKFLTPSQWEARYSPSISSVDQVRSFLKSNGFTVGRTPADRMEVPATGTAAQVERVFATSLGYYRVRGRILRLADQDLSVPGDVAGVVAGVSGVSQSLAQPDNTTGAARTAPSPTATPFAIKQPAGFRIAQPCGSYYGQKIDTTLPAYGNGYPSTPPWAVCGYTPPQFRSAYGLNGSADGTGVTVAVVDAYASPTLLSDAQRFAADNDPSHPLASSQFSEQLANSFTETQKCGASGWFGEQTLDVEAVHGTAPGAKILFAGAASCFTQPLNDALRGIVDGHLADVITNSYGDNGGDLLDSSSDRISTDDILLMADGTGISVLFSSGDNGDEFTTVGAVTPDYPASSPYATAVGGTTLQIGSDGSRTGEFGWSTARSFLCDATWAALGGCTTAQEGTWLPIDLALDGGSGGGTSYVYPQPNYQAGVVPTALAEANGAAVPMRVVPDISMEADPATGMLVGETQTFPNGVYYDTYRIGGTSVASPLFAGVVARADEAAGKPLGLLNPALYQTLSSESQAIRDIGPAGARDMSRADYVNSIDSSAGYYYTTRIVDYEGPEQFCTSSVGKTGQHTTCTTRNVALNTATGYDNMTGLGSPGTNFVADLAASGK
ncbi:MAG TPA: S53 family peptidase [Solirubrobacteraceae bacterium]|nr:S53 family peptidase [Solirubrobacteraceae bacterium]